MPAFATNIIVALISVPINIPYKSYHRENAVEIQILLDFQIFFPYSAVYIFCKDTLFLLIKRLIQKIIFGKFIRRTYDRAIA